MDVPTAFCCSKLEEYFVTNYNYNYGVKTMLSTLGMVDVSCGSDTI